MHIGLFGRPVGLAGVAGNATAYDICPGREPAVMARHHVINIQFLAVKLFAAVLAGILVALEDILACELHFLVGNPVKKTQEDDAWNADANGDGPHHIIVFAGKPRIIAPLTEGIRVEAVGFLVYDLGMAGVKQCEGTIHRADVDRLPQAVQHQHMRIDMRWQHDSPFNGAKKYVFAAVLSIASGAQNTGRKDGGGGGI